MGILDFAREGAAKQLAEQVTAALSKLNIQGLDVAVDEGVVTLTGKAASNDVKKKAAEALASLDGIKQIKNELSVEAPAVEGTEKSETGENVYTVVAGDTLWGLSERFYGDGSKYMKIFEANREVWKNYNYDPNVIYVGWKLVIPQA
ncbi:MAG: peptidoglycan-binding protein LysM [Microscillaceae bacterium]